MKKTIIILIMLIISTSLFAQNDEVKFDNHYINANNGKTTIEINQMQELVYIILALTETGKNPAIVKQSTEYYQEVIKHFSPYASHEIVKSFSDELNTNLVNFILLPANAYAFKLESHKIIPTNIYIFPAKGIGKFEIKENPIIHYIPLLEDFAKQSHFEDFYKNHQSYYESLIKEYENFAAIDKQKKWLEDKFEYKINSYRVLTSPLINSINATHTFENNQFRETLLFLPTILNEKDWSNEMKKAVNTRVIFTEIDHNYVGPVSELNKIKIEKAFSNRQLWVDEKMKGIEHYPNPIKLFDEYLTWGLYMLYAMDNYDETTVNNMVDQLNNIMVNKRGFIKFKEYNTFLMQLYKNNKQKKIQEFYPELLDWASKQH